VDISGYVVLGIVTLFLVYLMPQLIRGRQDLVDSRLADRFSADLRILATAGTAGGGARLAVDGGAPRAYLHDPRLRTEVSAMNRPLTRVARPVSPDSVNPGGKRESNSRPAPALAQRPQVSAALVQPAASGVAAQQRPAGAAARGPSRPEVAGRRKAAARRRLVLTLVLLALSAGAWVAVGTAVAHVALAAAPTVLLAIVLVLGRRAAAAAARADRAARRAPARPARPVAVAPRDCRPEATASRVLARPAARPAGRDARAAHAGTTAVLAAQRANLNAQRSAAQNGSTEASHAPAALARAVPSTARPATSGSAPVAAARASREAGTEIIPRVRPVATPAGAVDALRWSGEPAAPHARETEVAALEDGPLELISRPDVQVAEGARFEREEAPGDVGPAAVAPSNRSWTPVPVPVPTYTLKPAAPRLSPPALSAAEGGPVEAPAAAEPVAASWAPQTAAVSATDAVSATEAVQAAQAAEALEAVGVEARTQSEELAEAVSASGLDLDAVLSRRRASGE
jgi:hypothetical protein